MKKGANSKTKRPVKFIPRLAKIYQNEVKIPQESELEERELKKRKQKKEFITKLQKFKVQNSRLCTTLLKTLECNLKNDKSMMISKLVKVYCDELNRISQREDGETILLYLDNKCNKYITKKSDCLTLEDLNEIGRYFTNLPKTFNKLRLIMQREYLDGEEKKREKMRNVRIK
jgi:transketolase